MSRIDRLLSELRTRLQEQECGKKASWDADLQLCVPAGTKRVTVKVAGFGGSRKIPAAQLDKLMAALQSAKIPNIGFSPSDQEIQLEKKHLSKLVQLLKAQSLRVGEIYKPARSIVGFPKRVKGGGYSWA